MAGKVKMNTDSNGVARIQEENRKMVKDCKEQLAHWNKVDKDYECLHERLVTLPDKLSYDAMVPFGPMAFIPGRLVHTNEVTVLLGDNWFAKCSAKQAEGLVDHRRKLVKKNINDLHKVMKSFKDRADFTEDLEKMTDRAGDIIDIREMVGQEALTKGKPRVAHKPNSKRKEEYVVELGEELGEEPRGESGAGTPGVLSESELWARLDELERLEVEQDERDRLDSTDTNGEETSSSSSEEEKEAEVNGHSECYDGSPACTGHVNVLTGPPRDGQDEEGEAEECSGLPTIYFSHTIEPKKVRINTGKNTTLKFSERKEQKEQAKRKKKSVKSNGHSVHEHHKITTPADIYRVFVDVVNGEPVPRKSILKSRSRENSVCSDTSESSTAEFEERRGFFGRAQSHEEGTHSDASDGVTEDDGHVAISLYPNGRFEAFSGTVVEKDPLPSSIPHLTISPPALPTIPERKQEEVGSEAPQELPKRVSKFKAARLQQK